MNYGQHRQRGETVIVLGGVAALTLVVGGIVAFAGLWHTGWFLLWSW